jgi:uncharacterized protein (DUF1330 family)
MNTNIRMTLAAAAGVAVCAVTIQAVNAQTKPMAYIIAEVEVTDPGTYQTYLDRNTPLVASAGGRYLSRGENIIALDGTPPKRYAILAFDTVEMVQAYRDLPAYKEIMPLRDKGAKFRSFIVEGSVSGTLGK